MAQCHGLTLIALQAVVVIRMFRIGLMGGCTLE